MAGDIKLKYGTALTPTVTNLQSLASNSTFTSGWTSAWIDNTSTLALDYGISAALFAGTSPSTNPGEIRVYAYAEFPDGSDPDLFSSGTEGTEGTCTLHDTENLDSGLILLWSTSTDTTSDASYPMPQRSIAAAFGFVPRKFALYIAHNTGVNLKSSGQVVHAEVALNQYT